MKLIPVKDQDGLFRDSTTGAISCTNDQGRKAARAARKQFEDVQRHDKEIKELRNEIKTLKEQLDALGKHESELAFEVALDKAKY